MKCGNCKERGVTLAHVKVCYGMAPAPSSPQAAPKEPMQRVNIWKPTDLPAGRYAVTLPDDRLHFFKVDKPDSGRWAGATFVKEQASDDLHPVRGDRYVLVRELLEKDPQAAMLAYGRNIGRCGHCGRTLTNEDSRARGIGPICAERMGW